MVQRRMGQYGTFHITTNAEEGVQWCTLPGIPEMLIDNLIATKNLHGALIHAFCILDDHMHIILTAGQKGVSNFMHSFKRNSSRDVRPRTLY